MKYESNRLTFKTFCVYKDSEFNIEVAIIYFNKDFNKYNAVIPRVAFSYYFAQDPRESKKLNINIKFFPKQFSHYHSNCKGEYFYQRYIINKDLSGLFNVLTCYYTNTNILYININIFKIMIAHFSPTKYLCGFSIYLYRRFNLNN